MEHMDDRGKQFSAKENEGAKTFDEINDGVKAFFLTKYDEYRLLSMLSCSDARCRYIASYVICIGIVQFVTTYLVHTHTTLFV